MPHNIYELKYITNNIVPIKSTHVHSCIIEGVHHPGVLCRGALVHDIYDHNIVYVMLICYDN